MAPRVVQLAVEDVVVGQLRQQLGERDLAEPPRAGVLLGVPVVQAVLVLDVDHLLHAEHLGELEQAEVRAVHRQVPGVRRRLPEVVGRHRDRDRRDPGVEVQRQVPEVVALHRHRAVRGEQGVEQDRVELLHRADQLRHAADRQAEIERDRDRVADAGAAADADHHLDAAVALDLDQLLDQRQDRGLAAVEDALAADRHQGHVGEHPEIAVALGLGQDAAVLQGLAHQARVDVGAAVAADELGHGGLHSTPEKQQRRQPQGPAPSLITNRRSARSRLPAESRLDLLRRPDV